MSNDPVVIVAARRTPIGAFQGAFSAATAIDLGAASNKAAVADAGIDPALIGEVVMGCVLPAGLGQAPARQAAIAAGIPKSVASTTINKMCGSGMKAAMFAHDMLLAGSVEVALAGGLESMTNAPYLLPKARSGYRMGHQEVQDHMFYDGLQSPFDGNMMGHFAELTADKYNFTREAQDAFATASVERALHAIEQGWFDDEIAPVDVTARRKTTTVSKDEDPFHCDLSKIPTMRPAFRRDGGTVTAASSSSISDGAASLIMMRESAAQTHGVTPLARICGHSTFAQEPEWFTTAPVSAIDVLLKKLSWKTGDVDLYEINEAFAVVSMAAMHDLKLEHEKVNVHGGACALGHPVGATGARLIVTLLHALKRRQLKRGVAALCIGGGEATAIGIEMV
ncbi:MAG: acetyl-CoA C-acyltransferase [Gammaproteobacteria bacterium]